MTRVLVVDDKEMMRDSVQTTLSRKGFEVSAAHSGESALASLARRPVQVVVTDLQMPGMDGLELIERIRAFDEELPVVFMTAYGSVETAVEAMRRGAWDYITKPFSGDELVVAVQRAVEHATLRRENQVLKLAHTPSSGSAKKHQMIGRSGPMTELKADLDRMAASHGTVLIRGESGTGKEVASRWIHAHSPRSSAPFLALNCAALSTSLLESELFGHEKGAFTGADKLRKGRFELADGGTLLLDEVSEIAPSVQAKLLRVLQEKSFERVGSSQSRAVDVRVIATSNRNLESEVARGNFRQDLFYRLNVLPLEIPPLRDRREDISDLSAVFLARVAEREGIPARRFNDAAIECLTQYDWPGNVRELQNICERAFVLARDEVIDASLIAPWIGAAAGMPQRAASQIEASPMMTPRTNGATPLARRLVDAHGTNGSSFSNGHANGHTNGHANGQSVHGANGATAVLDDRDSASDGSTSDGGQLDIVCTEGLTLERIEREIIVNTLMHNGGHRRKSAEALGIGVRTLGLKLKKWKEESLVEASL